MELSAVGAVGIRFVGAIAVCIVGGVALVGRSLILGLVLLVGVVIVILFLHVLSPPSVTIMPAIPTVYTNKKRKYWELIGLLPEKFESRMKILLGNEWDAFLQAMQQPAFRGLRWNPLKCSLDTLRKSLDFPLRPTPFSPLSYEIPPAVERIGQHPLHHAGAFYVQEPSASSAVTILNPQPGDRVLDVCAAPGGKSTQIGACLQGKGLLWSNELIKNRANILLSNMERMGIRNCVISSCHPDILGQKLAGYFDKVLVDAPCSGEGMFHRDPNAIAEWSLEHVQACAGRQFEILHSVSQTVRENGVLVYSTCTFSTEENEQVVERFLQKHPEFQLEDCGVSFGRPSQTFPMARRIFPMDGGDGHFVARMKRVQENPICPSSYQYLSGREKQEKAAREWLTSILNKVPDYPMLKRNGHIYFLPPDLPCLDGLGVMRAGILALEEKTNRFEPAHQLFTSAAFKNCRQVLNLPADSLEVRQFLAGEELEVQSHVKGFVTVAVEGIPFGFGKASNGRLKNRYPKGLRNHNIS